MRSQRLPYNRRKALQIATAAATAGLAVIAPTADTLGAENQAKDDQSRQPDAAPARPEDVRSMDAIVAALYQAISGPVGRRDLDRLRSLFHPGARLIPCFPARQAQEQGMNSMRVYTVDQFIEAIEPRVKQEGFFEREIARRVELFGAIAHVFSTYESRRAANDPQPFSRGINSIQLFFDGKRWWTITVFWDSERPGRSIPAEYLPKRP
jgi:hypothetical protein